MRLPPLVRPLNPLTRSKLTRSQRSALVTGDLRFLRAQLANESIRLLLIDGRAVLDTITEATGCVATRAERLDFGGSSTTIQFGRLCDVTVIMDRQPPVVLRRHE